MLHSYAFSNFQSFRRRTEVSLVLNKKAPLTGWERTSADGTRLTTALAILGANAAGKTALLQPLAFARWFILHSFKREPDAEIGINTHRASPNEPFEFEMVAEDEKGVVWRYELKATKERVLHEALYKKKSRFVYV